MNHYIYLITNLINGKRYIGKRSCNCDINKDRYMGSGIYLTRAIKKYGRENFHKKVIDICKSEEEAFNREKYWIKKHNAHLSRDFYNISPGGTGGNLIAGLSAEEKRRIYKKIGEKLKGKTVSMETKKLISIKLKGRSPWNKGKIMDNKYKETVSKYHADVSGKNNPMYGVKLYGDKNGFYGKKHTKETTKKISDKNKDYWKNLSEDIKKERVNNLINKRRYNRICESCGENFKSKGSNTKLCDMCKEKNKKPLIYERVCKSCNEKFMGRAKNSMKCDKCKK